MPAYEWPVKFESPYECMVAGYEEAAKKTKEMGRHEVNKYKTYIKFDCIETIIIIPKEKPQEDTQPKVETSYQI
jgi:hypothetical protein